jgi:predicted aspartyl protease
VNSKKSKCAVGVFVTAAALLWLNSPSFADQDCNAPNGEYGSFAMQSDNDGHVAASVSIGDKLRLMIVDTGGAVSMLSSAVVKEMNLTPRAAAWEREISARGGVTRDFVNVPSFAFGRVHLDGERFAVWPDEDPMLSHSAANGLLAPDVLAKFDVDFDFGNSTIKLFRSDHCAGKISYWSPTYASLPFRLDDNGHVIVDMTLDGKPVKVLIDTGAPASTMTLPDAEQLFGLSPQSPGMKEGGSFPAASGQSQTFYTYRFSSLVMDGLTVKNPSIGILPDDMAPEIPGHFHPYDMILGLKDIEMLHMYIAYGERTLYFTGRDARYASVAAQSSQTSASADAPRSSGTQTGGNNSQSVSIAIKNEYPADYPLGAVEKNEEGVALVGITKENGEYKASLGYSSGYADLDDASLKLAVPYFLSGAAKDTNIIAVRWGLGTGRSKKFNLGRTPKPGDPALPADTPMIAGD